MGVNHTILSLLFGISITSYHMSGRICASFLSPTAMGGAITFAGVMDYRSMDHGLSVSVPDVAAI